MRHANLCIIAPGRISGQCLDNLPHIVSLMACAAIRRGTIERRTAEVGIPPVLTVPEMSSDTNIGHLDRFTTPATHDSI